MMAKKIKKTKESRREIAFPKVGRAYRSFLK